MGSATHLRCNQVLDVTLKAHKVFVITLMHVGLVEGKESMKMDCMAGYEGF